MRGLPRGPVERPGSPLDLLRHFSVFSNELCRLAGSGNPEDQGEPVIKLVQRFEGSFSISESEALKLLHSAVEMVKTYAVIMNITPERSPFIQGLQSFIEADAPYETGASESPSAPHSDVNRGDDSPIKREAAAAEEEGRTREPDVFHPAEAYASSDGIWGRVLRLHHKLGFTKE
jgi:hypothetical protein